MVSYKTLFLNIITTVSHTFSPRRDKNLYTMIMKICNITLSGTQLVSHFTIITDKMCHPPPHCTHIHYLVSINIQKILMNISGCHFLPHGGIQFHIFTSHALPCQTACWQAAPLLPSITLQQNVTEYFQEGSNSTVIPSAFTSDDLGQNNKIRYISFGVTFINCIIRSFKSPIMY